MKRAAVMILTLLTAASLAGGCGGNRGTTDSSPTRVEVTVTEKGFEPEVVTVPFGKPVALVVTRKTDQTCAKNLIIMEHDIRRDLPLDQPVEITFTPKKRGDLIYACGMDMIRGTVRVE